MIRIIQATIGVCLIGLIWLAIYQADQIPIPGWSLQAEKIRVQIQQITQNQLDGQALNQLSNNLDSNQVAGANTEVIKIGDQEIQVEALLAQLAGQLEQIPKQQYQKLQQSICAPLLESSSTPTSSNSSQLAN